MQRLRCYGWPSSFTTPCQEGTAKLISALPLLGGFKQLYACTNHSSVAVARSGQALALSPCPKPVVEEAKHTMQLDAWV